MLTQCKGIGTLTARLMLAGVKLLNGWISKQTNVGGYDILTTTMLYFVLNYTQAVGEELH